MIRVKICGITSVEDAHLAAQAGADAIGLNFVEGPRRLQLDQAARILKSLPPLITPVALVRLRAGQLEEGLRTLLDARHVRSLQVYGDVNAGVIHHLTRSGFHCIWPVPVKDARFAEQVRAALNPHLSGPAMILLDTRRAALAGGTGVPWPWRWLAEARSRGELAGWPPIMLAGGLTPDTVAQAIQVARPAAVDVASGVEQSPGRKDPAKLRAFVEAARQT